MVAEGLADFLSLVEEDGELRRVPVEVDPRLELAAITHRCVQQSGGGPAIVFEQVRSSRFSVVANLLGSQKRLCRALGVRSLIEFRETFQPLFRNRPAEGWLQKLKQLSPSGNDSGWEPVSVRTAACQQVVKVGRDVDLLELPAISCWPRELGTFLHGAQIWTKHPESGEISLETCPLEVRDRATLGVHWNSYQQAARNFEIHRQRGLPMPFVISFGGDPLYSLLSNIPPPPHLDPVSFAGFLRSRGVELVRCRQVEAAAPADAEMVLEGYLDPGDAFQSGGAHGLTNGHYSIPQPVPMLKVAGMTHRGNPVLPMQLPSGPPSEQTWRDLAAVQLTLPWLQFRYPEIVKLSLPMAGCGTNYCFVSIRKNTPHHASRIMHALWSERLTMFSKFLVVVDEDVDLYDEDQVWGAIGTNAAPERDLMLVNGPAPPMDHAADSAAIGKQLGIDATRKWPEEGYPREWPGKLSYPAEILQQVQRRWDEYRLSGG